jgi:hypothetical protein
MKQTDLTAMRDPRRNDLAWTPSLSSGIKKTQMKADIVIEIDALLACLSEIGITVNRNSRLYIAREIIDALSKHEIPSEKRLGADALRTILTTNGFRPRHNRPCSVHGRRHDR